MAKRRSPGSKQEPEPGPIEPGTRLALRLLATLRPAVIVPPSQRDPLHVAELLLDHAYSLPLDQACDAFVDLLYEPMLERAKSMMLRESYLFAPDRLAAVAVSGMFAAALVGRRVRPVEEFLDRGLERAITRYRGTREVLLFADVADRSRVQKLANVMAQLANRGTFALRRACWSMWIDHLPIDEAATRSGIPLERLEMLVATMMKRAIVLMEIDGDAAEAGADAMIGDFDLDGELRSDDEGSDDSEEPDRPDREEELDA
jgi:hypothetical protein